MKEKAQKKQTRTEKNMGTEAIVNGWELNAVLVCLS